MDKKKLILNTSAAIVNDIFSGFKLSARLRERVEAKQIGKVVERINYMIPKLKQAKGSHLDDELEQTIKEQADKIERLVRALRTLQAGSPGVCMCGASMDGHSLTDGHTPTDMFDYTIDSALEEADEL